MSEVDPGQPDPSEVVPTSNSTGAPVDADLVDDVHDDDVDGGEETAPDAP